MPPHHRRRHTALRRTQAVTLTVLALVAVSAGCGGAGDSTLATSALGQSEYEKRAEEICARGRLQALHFTGPPKDGESEREALTGAVEKSLLPALRGVVRRLYSLGAPAGEKARTAEFLSTFQEGIDAAEELRIPTLRNIEDKLEPTGILAERAGLDACVYG